MDNLADEIAYNAHDIDDGVRSGLLTLAQLQSVELFRHHSQQALQQHPTLQGRRLLFETIRLMLSAQVYDVMQATSRALDDAKPQDVTAVRQHTALVCFTPAMAAQSAAMKSFLLHNLYRHPQVLEKTQAAQQVVRDLFACYMAEPAQMPFANIMYSSSAKPERVVADYIAGMTDRFAAKEHERLSGKVTFAA